MSRKCRKLRRNKIWRIKCILLAEWNWFCFRSHFSNVERTLNEAPRGGTRRKTLSYFSTGPNKYMRIRRNFVGTGWREGTGRQTCRSQIAEVVDDSFRWTALCMNHMQNVEAKYEYAPRQWPPPISFLSIVSHVIARRERCSKGT